MAYGLRIGGNVPYSGMATLRYSEAFAAQESHNGGTVEVWYFDDTGKAKAYISTWKNGELYLTGKLRAEILLEESA